MTATLRTDPGGFRIRWSDTTAQAYRAAGHWRDETLTAVARRAVQADPGRVLLIEGDKRLTRGEAWGMASRLASFFIERGLKPGDVVSVQLPNWVEAAVIGLAARMAGLIINPIPPIYRESELGYILKDCGAKMIFTPHVFRRHDYRAMVEGLRAELPALKDVVTVRGGEPGDLRYEDALAAPEAADADLPSVDSSAVMMVMYTSGTTGRAKGVLHTHYTYDYRVRTLGAACGLGADDVVFMPSPVTHITGAIWCIDMPWVWGSSSVLIDVWAAEEGIQCIETNRCTVSGGATPFLRQLLDTAEGRPEAIASLRLFFCGGTTVSPDLIREASEKHPHGLFFRAYGSTEVPSVTLGISGRAETELGAETDGKIDPTNQVKIVDPETDAELPEGAEGEILARGPEQFAGYLSTADNDGAFDDEGYFRMGDLGRRVHGDYLVITGRKKDIIIRSGENISPKEVEDLLSTHPAVTEVAIVAMPSATTGEKGCAFIIPAQGQTIDLAEIRRFLDEAGLARQKFPEHVVLVDDLPRVPSGKVRKDVLRTRARELAEGAPA